MKARFLLLCPLGAAALMSLSCSESLRNPLLAPPVDSVAPPVDSVAPPVDSVGVVIMGLIVSEPTHANADGGDASFSAAVDGLAYISLPPGALPNAANVRIRNLTTGASIAPTLVLNGGFDPVAIAASIGDRLDLEIHELGGTTTHTYMVVPRRRRPSVIRTDPPKGRTDVALNSRPLAIFSEPIDPRSLTATSVRLLRGGTAVDGTVRLLSSSSLSAEFVPAVELEPSTTYEFLITEEVKDLDGEELESVVRAEFTTKVKPAASPPFVAVAAGDSHSCALTAVGAAFCWGVNDYGQTGLVYAYSDRNKNPMPVVGGHVFASLAAGALHSCGITTAGTAMCWGANHSGELGSDFRGTTDCGELGDLYCSAWPIRVEQDPGLVSVVAGWYSSCGLGRGGVASFAYCWGGNFYAQNGTADTSVRFTPTRVAGDLLFTSLAAGGNHNCGLTANGAAYCWGANVVGQLGADTARLDLCPYQTTPCSVRPVAVAGGLSFKLLTAGDSHTCGLTVEGRVYCWGANTTHQLGVLTTSEACPGWNGASEPCSTVPVAVLGEMTFVSLSTGAFADHTCAITAAGAAYCWGSNVAGQLGDGLAGAPSPSQASSAQPVRVAGGLAFSMLAAGRRHTCGRTTSSEVHCWGSNDAGQLGDSSQGNTRSPNRIRAP